jgi:hypothetical protein
MCEEFGNICRAVWNTVLEQRRQYRRRGAWMNGRFPLSVDTLIIGS